jgi:hypothetical protein
MGAALTHQAFAHDEVTVAALDEQCHTAIRSGSQRGAHAIREFCIIVVTDPDIEQIAEDEQSVACLRVVGEEVFEQGERVRALDREMQI